MYHYVVIRKVFFLLILLLISFFINDSYALKSPREKWNYQKKEDNINHHTIKVRIKSKKSEKIENSSDSNEYNSVINEIGEDGTKKIERPGSPRDRW